MNSKGQAILSQAYILSGSPCSGKSTLAERLSAAHGFQYYKVDDHGDEHGKRIQPDRHPVMHAFIRRTWNEIWMRPVEAQVQEELVYYRERFEMIVEDLAQFDPADKVLLEGAGLLPDLVAPLHARPERVIVMVPTLAFQLHHYQQRPWIQSILQDCEDPHQAFENWMMRDHLFGQEMLRQAETYAYKRIVVDGEYSLDEMYAQVQAYWGLA
ncbi:MAG: hypothetical protein HY835_14515 [Anaerolineae bacterium]|nr:hypothetical protein [Anaerolineae bacterium]